MDDKKTVYCYKDPDGKPGYAVSDAADAAAFEAENPGLCVTMAFPRSADSLRRGFLQEQEFIRLARKYDLLPTDYNARFMNPGNGRIYRLIGLKSRNTVYKAICVDETRDVRVKMTLSVLKHGLAHNRIAGA